MIIKATEAHIKPLTLMLADMYYELFGADVSTSIQDYVKVIAGHFADPRDTVYIDDKLHGFFVVRDETEIIAPTLHRYNGIRVYIHKEHRKGRLLAEFYARLFEDFPNGDILGSTEINSEHIAVLDKRHIKIAHVYKLNREKT